MGKTKRKTETAKSGRTKASAKAAESSVDATREGSNSREGAGSGIDAPASFEVALEQLETSVARLEEGEMPLEQALELFESGVKLSRQCQSTLEQAEQRVEILVGDGGSDGESATSVAFDLVEDEEADQDDDGSETED